MDDTRKKLINRIVGLFKLGQHQATGQQTGTTEAEMLMAVTKARQLMARHAISMHEVEKLRGGDVTAAIDARMRDTPVFTRSGKKLAEYDWLVASAVATLTDTMVLERFTEGRNKKGHYTSLISVVFLGDEDDVALAGQLFHLWLRDVRRMARANYGSDSWGMQHTSYAIGMASRLQERAREQIQLSADDQQTWGLVLASKQAAVQRLAARIINLPTRERKLPSINDVALARGYHDGAAVSINTKIIK